ncbi:hypothetical protein IAT38_004833 [Cryptococcus sp. DSM 104549]
MSTDDSQQAISRSSHGSFQSPVHWPTCNHPGCSKRLPPFAIDPTDSDSESDPIIAQNTHYHDPTSDTWLCDPHAHALARQLVARSLAAASASSETCEAALRGSIAPWEDVMASVHPRATGERVDPLSRRPAAVERKLRNASRELTRDTEATPCGSAAATFTDLVNNLWRPGLSQEAKEEAAGRLMGWKEEWFPGRGELLRREGWELGTPGAD